MLISRGSEVNAEDGYGNTPLDFQEVSPNDGILYLLLDHDARNGAGKDETERLNRLMNRLSTASKAGDLLFTGMVKGQALIDRPSAPRECMNATGDKLETDGKMAVLVLK